MAEVIEGPGAVGAPDASPLAPAPTHVKPDDTTAEVAAVSANPNNVDADAVNPRAETHFESEEEETDSEEETDDEEEETDSEEESGSEEEETDSEEEETDSSELETDSDDDDETDDDEELASAASTSHEVKLPEIERTRSTSSMQAQEVLHQISEAERDVSAAGPGPSSAAGPYSAAGPSSAAGPCSAAGPSSAAGLSTRPLARGEPGRAVVKKAPKAPKEARDPKDPKKPKEPKKGGAKKGASSTTKLPPVKSAQPRSQPEPAKAAPPRARHPTENVDPEFIRTAAYTHRPGVGNVYDWETHHNQNKHIQHQKNEQKRACELIDAARKELENRSNSERAFQQWLEQKEREKMRFAQRRKELLQLASIPMMYSDPPEVKVAREKQWCDSFGTPANIARRNAPLAASERRQQSQSAGTGEARRPLRLDALLWQDK